VLRELKTFLAVVRWGTFAAAGSRIGLTQSAVSAQMQRLEEALGAPLFTRTGRSATLNEAGEEADMIDAFSGTLPREIVMLTQARRQLERLEMVSEKDLRGLIAHAASCRSESRLR